MTSARNKIYELFHSPIGKNIIANCLKVGVIFLNQIVLVPLYIIYWGKELYSDWIVITAMAAFFTISDAGLNSVTSNRFCMKFSQKEYSECHSLIINNFVLVSAIGLIIVALTFIGGFFINWTAVLGLHTVSNQEAHIVVTLLLVQIFLFMASSIMDAIYNANHLASKATYLNNIGRLSIALLILFGIVMNFSLTLIVTLTLIPLIIIIFYKKIDTNRLFNLPLSFAHFDKQLLREVLKPSLTYMAFPCGNALIFQGFTLVVNHFFGANLLVLFNTTRTLVNFVRTMVETVTLGVKPELSIAFGEKAYKKVKNILNKTVIASVLISLLLCIFLLIMGEKIYSIWTKGAVEFSYTLMLAFFIVVIANSFWNASSVVMLAINKHTRIGIIYLISTFLAISTAYFISYWHQLEYTAICIAISDIIMCVFAYRETKKVINSIK